MQRSIPGLVLASVAPIILTSTGIAQAAGTTTGEVLAAKVRT